MSAESATRQASESARDVETEVDSTSDTVADESESVLLDAVFEVLKNERRRRVLTYLRDHESPAELGTVCEHIAALENDTTVAQLGSKERKRVYVGLYQCHLPKMDAMGFVRFEKNRGTIELGPAAPEAFAYLDDGPDAEPEATSLHAWLAFAGVGGSALLAVLAAPGLVPGGAATVTAGLVLAALWMAARPWLEGDSELPSLWTDR